MCSGYQDTLDRYPDIKTLTAPRKTEKVRRLGWESKGCR